MSALIDTFEKLIDCSADDDDIFACLTFGTKVQSEILGMAVKYSYRIMKNSSISCMVYGEIKRDFSNPLCKECNIYDITLLSQIDEIVRMLADRKASNPREYIRRMLSLDENA